MVTPCKLYTNKWLKSSQPFHEFVLNSIALWWHVTFSCLVIGAAESKCILIFSGDLEICAE